MLVFGKLGSHGNFGNQCFEIASTIGIAHDNNQECTFPYWKYSHYFQNKLPTIQRVANAVTINEKEYHYTPVYWSSEISKHPERLVNILGWLQSEKYWKNCERKIRDQFTFKEEYKNKLKEKYKEVFYKPTIAISIRRGDFVKNSNYELLPANYYIGALIKNFPKYKDYNIFCFSDDIPYCRHHFECLDNVFYPQAALDIDQLCLMSMCDNFIISQSTFSWWGAYLGQKEGSIVVRPNYNMAGELLKNSNEKDFWPVSWTNIYDHKKEKIDLSDTTFTIPVCYDHEDRAQNLRLNIKYLQSNFDTNIIVGEQGGDHFPTMGDKYIKFDYKEFHRTKMLNEMAMAAETEIIANWDADVIVPPMQIVESIKRLRDDADMVYPYDGRFGRVERKKWYTEIRDMLDTGVWKKERFVGTRDSDSKSVGGALFLKKDSFLSAGMENEYFVSYAPEDQERWFRFRALGFKVERIKGNLYHIDHHIGPNSYTQHPLYKENEKEFWRVRNATNLQEDIEKWPWYKKYSNKYYEEIIGGSTRSRDIIFQDTRIYTPGDKIIDLGCGIGQWGVNLPNYWGIDFKIPTKILQIPQTNYKEFDITSNNSFPLSAKYDLALCLEVMEHIPEEFAEKTVQLLTALAPKVLFSAAIPGQGGVGHVNEKWQPYWAAIFRKFNYYPQDITFTDPEIEIWYRNNAILYTNQPSDCLVIEYVHPELYTNIVGTHTRWKNIKPYKNESPN